MAIKSFIFSQTQQAEQKKLYGKNYAFGHVIVNGQKKIYTDILKDPSKCRFSDAKVLITGEMDKISYTKPRK